ncbi:MAG: RecX family transcriptional regulator [Treponemataceae bacterium]|nr:RecX family transcriptional regulator [Treponemataceae bacterium]
MEQTGALQVQTVSSKAGIHRIRLSDGTLCLVRSEYLKSGIDVFLLSEGTEIGASEKEALLFASSYYRIEREALRYISRAEQSKKGLFKKLYKKGYNREQIMEVIQFLESKGLVNDERYATSYLSYRLGKDLYSPRQLVRALVARGIELSLARRVYQNTISPLQEREMLFRFVRKQGIDELPPAKLKHCLFQEGFRKELIREYLLQKREKGNL